MKQQPNQKTKAHFETNCVHAGIKPDPTTGAIMTPIFQTSTYAQAEIGQQYEYARVSNPTRDVLQESLAALEETRYAYSFSSGLAAADMICRLLRPGDEIVANFGLYGGVHRLFEQVYKPLGIQTHYVSMDDMDKLEEHLSSSTRLVWLETPSNPVLQIIDIEKVAQLARKYGALTVVDNTFATPYLQKPIKIGADIVFHSVTKYLNGHSDVIMGAVCCSDPALAEEFKAMQRNLGAVPSPMDCFLALRGVKTLHLRMEQHCRSAMRVAQFLEQHPSVETLYYPGLKTHPGHEIAARQMSHQFGGMISFTIKNAKDEEIMRFFQSLKIFALAESLGGVESLANYPAKMTYASMTEEDRLKRHITNNLVRLSIGIEHTDDLIDDLKSALSIFT